MSLLALEGPRGPRAVLALAALLALAGCRDPEPAPGPRAPSPPIAPPAAAPGAPAPVALGAVASVDSRLVHNLRRVSERVYSSARPEGEEAFRALAALGIRTVISVDGERPQIEAARRAGLRYVHVPFGYAGVPRERALALVRATRDLEGPFLVHCHHGTQRGPAGAAIARLACEGGSREDALAELRAAGAQPRYKGLAASVASFARPAPEELDGVELVEVAPPSTLVELMVEVDQRFDALVRGAPAEGDWKHEVLLLREALAEVGRAVPSRGSGWTAAHEATLAAVAVVEAEAAKGPPSRASLDRVKASCTSCHETYRDR